MEKLNPETAAHNVATTFVEQYAQNFNVSIESTSDKNELMIKVHKAAQIYMFAYSEAYKRIETDIKSGHSYQLEF